MRKNVLLQLESRGASNVLREFHQIRSAVKGTGEDGAAAASKLKKGFGVMADEAKKTAAAIAAVFTAAVATANKAVKAFSDFETGLLRANRMLKFGQGELDAFGGRLRAMADGPLGTVPGLLDNASDAVYSYISALGETHDQSAIFADLEAAARAAAASGAELNDIMSNGARIAAVAGTEHGNLANIFDLLATTEQFAIGSLNEVTEGIAKAIGPMNAFGGDTQTAAAAVAELTKTGRTAVESATMLRTVLANFEREQRDGGVFDRLGIQATDFVGIIEELGDVQLDHADKQALFGKRYAGFFTKLIDNGDRLRSTFESLGDAQAVIRDQFNAYAHSTLAETTRRTNELQREQIELGERMKEIGPFVENLKTRIQIGIGEIAEFIIKNKEAAIGAIFAIRAAMAAFKAGSPLGWLMAGVQLAVGAVMGLISLFDDSTQKALDTVRASKQLIEKQKANVDATRDQTKAQIENAKANNASAESIARLEETYQELTETSNKLTQSIHALAIEEAALNTQVALEAAAAEIGEGVGEDKLLRELQLLDEQLISAERRAEVTNDLAVMTGQIAASMDDSSKIQAAMVEFLERNTGLTREQAELATEEVTSREEAQDLIDAIGQSLNSNVIKQEELAAAAADEEKARLEQLGIEKQITTLKTKGVDMSLKEVQAAVEALEIMRVRLNSEKALLSWRIEQAIANDEFTRAAKLTASYDELAASYRQIAADARVAAEAAGRLRDKASGYDDGDDDGGGGGETAEQERIIERADFELEIAKTRAEQLEEYRRSLMETRVKEEHDRRVGSVKAVFEQQQALMQKLASAQETAYRAIASTFVTGIEQGMLKTAVDFVKTIALQMLENAIVMALLSLSTGGSFTMAGLFKGTPFGGFFAEGGYVPSTPGGQMIVAGEGGRGEYVIPEDVIAGYSQYGAFAPAMAAAEVSGQAPPSVSVSPNVSVPPAQITIVMDARGVWTVAEQGRRMEERAQG